MERLKSAIPLRLRMLILSTPAANLSTSSAALLHYFSTSPDFSQLLEQLMNPVLTSCAKDGVGASNWKRDGNAAFSSQNYDRALSCYTKALRYAPFLCNKEDDRVALATLFINRASTLHMLGLLEPALRDCDRAMDLYPSYSKVWYRRGRVKCDLSDFAGAAKDMEKALSIETSSGGRLQIQRELAQMELNLRSAHSLGCTQSHSPSANSGASSDTMKQQMIEGIDCLQKHWSNEKGWSLQTKKDLSSGSLVFQEDPYAAVMLKSSRDTYCHFCFEFLPVDPVPCSGCAIPLYCSDLCRTWAIGCLAGHDTRYINTYSAQNSSAQLVESGKCKLKVTEDGGSSYQRWGEHKPECGGASWSAVLPTEAVLGARMLFRTVSSDNGLLARKLNLVKGAGDFSVDTLCHHYDHLNRNDKLELHVLGIVIAHCVNQSAMPLFETGTSIAVIASKLIGLITRARLNAMAIFGMSSPNCEVLGYQNYGTSSTAVNSISTSTSLCTVEQIKVAQGIYLIGSRLNHSCVPNVHASFVSGHLYIRAVTDIGQGCSLELCYGPQVGGLNQRERKQHLLERYFFTCTCPACSKLTLPDLLLRSFRCANPSCVGVVLGHESLESKFSGLEYSSSTTCTGVGEEKYRALEEYGLSKEKESKQIRQYLAATDVNLVDQRFSKISLILDENIGRCLCCGIGVDVMSAQDAARTASAHLERVASGLSKAKPDERDLEPTLTGALKALNRLRETVHAYSEQLAKGEDVIAQVLCALDQPLKALKHCQRSIEILEHLYNKQHIVIGNEYLKLASVALMASDLECARRSLSLADKIFRVHYGSDYGSRWQYVVHLQQILLQM